MAGPADCERRALPWVTQLLGGREDRVRVRTALALRGASRTILSCLPRNGHLWQLTTSARQRGAKPQVVGVPSPVSSPQTAGMDTISQNKNIVTSFIDALFTKGDLGAVDEYLARDYVDHDPHMGFPQPGGMRGCGHSGRIPHGAATSASTSGDLVVENSRRAARSKGEIFECPVGHFSSACPGSTSAGFATALSWSADAGRFGLMHQLGLVPCPQRGGARAYRRVMADAIMAGNYPYRPMLPRLDVANFLTRCCAAAPDHVSGCGVLLRRSRPADPALTSAVAGNRWGPRRRSSWTTVRRAASTSSPCWPKQRSARSTGLPGQRPDSARYRG